MCETDEPIVNSSVLFLAGDPGGASALLPVVTAWNGNKTLFAYRHAVQLFEAASVVFERLDETQSSTAGAVAILTSKRPALVCAATSVNGVDWERHFFIASRKRGIPTVAILDYWSNYVPRFTLTRDFDAVPDVIAIMDERARGEMIASGFPAQLLAITGQPVLDEVRLWHASLTQGSRTRFREQLGIAADTRVFLFISQPLREMRCATGHSPIMYDDEFDCLNQAAESIARVPLASKLLLVKLHPREAPNKYWQVISHLPCSARVLPPSIHRWEVCLAADRILGMDSMLMEEARVMGCPVECITHGVPLRLDGSYLSQRTANAYALPLSRDIISELITYHLQRGQPRPSHDNLPRN